MKSRLHLSFFLLLIFSLCSANTVDTVVGVTVTDDLANKLVFKKPARRIVSLAPHITEMLFSAGAGKYIVGVVNYSDYPDAAKKIASVGSYNQINIEAIIALKPDLIVAWESGNSNHIIEKLRNLGFAVFVNEPRSLMDIPDVVKRLSAMAGTNSDKAIKAYLKKYKVLKSKYSQKKPVKLFYQYWNNPLMTVNGKHIISDVIRLCSAQNIFSDLNVLAPAVTVEAVVASNVEVIIVGGLLAQHRQWLNEWRKWQDLPAVKNNHLYNVNPDLLQRHTLRLIDGAKELCQKVDLAR